MPAIYDQTFDSREAWILFQTYCASRKLQEKADEVLAAHEKSVGEYLDQVGRPAPHPFEAVPEGTQVRPLPDGGRLFVLPEGGFLRVTAEGKYLFAGETGELHLLEEGNGKLSLPDGRTLSLQEDAITTTLEDEGVEGLPATVVGMEIGAGRFSYELPEAIRLIVSRPDRLATVINPSGTLILLGPSRIEGIGEKVQVRTALNGTRGFACEESGHRGMVTGEGVIHLSLANGLDPVIRFPVETNDADKTSGPGPIPCGTKV